jgi:signal transduction histidine kinase
MIMLYNRRAVELWGREPKLGDTASDERFCGSFRLYELDGTFMPHDQSYMAKVLREGITVHDQELIIERPDGSRITVLANIAPIRDEAGTVIGAVNVFQDITKRKQAEQLLKQLSARLLQLQDEERRRIARELHDSHAQSLAALAMNLAILNKSAKTLDPRARQALAESLALSEACVREIRTISYLLHPPFLDEAGLASALRWYVDGFSQRSGIQVQLDVPAELGRLSRGVETTLFRIVQECLSNIHRHSGSPTAHIRIAPDSTQITLEVWDNGHGMPPEMLNSAGEPVAGLGVGIAGMQERVCQLQGKMEIYSSRRGTRVKVALPLHGGKS